MTSKTSHADPVVTPELVEQHGLAPEEFERIKKILGREPNYTELGIFSVMWSEHCSYKNTRPLLKTLPTKSRKILVGAGAENGGIIRDIFTMGARPLAAMNSLRFGPITEESAPTHQATHPQPLPGGEPARKSQIANRKSQIENNKRLFAGVVSGIAHYGNCFGIPTVAGEVYFDESYEGNPLVNAFCLGVLRHDQIARGKASGVGNPVFYVGPATGRDGLAGAAFASQDLTEESAEV